MDLPEALRGDEAMNCLDASLALSAKSSVDLRRSAKSQKLQLALPSTLTPASLPHQNPMMSNMSQMMAGFSGIPGGTAHPFMTNMMNMVHMASQLQHHMLQMQQLTSPGGTPPRPGDVVILQPPTSRTPQSSTPQSQNDSQQQLDMRQPLFDTGDDQIQSHEESGERDLAIVPAKTKTDKKPPTVIQQGQIVENAFRSRTLKKPSAAKPKAKAKTAAKAKPVAKSNPKAKAKSKFGEPLVMTRNAVHSRAYKSALLKHSKTMSVEKAKDLTRKDAQVALKKAGFKIK